MAVRQTSPEEFEDRIIFVSMFNNIDGTKKRNSNECFSISLKVRDYAKRFQRRHWSMLRREFEIEGAGVFSDSQWLMSLKKTEAATSQDFSIAWIRTRISCISVPSKVTQGERWLIPNCALKLKFHSDGKSTCTVH